MLVDCFIYFFLVRVVIINIVVIRISERVGRDVRIESKWYVVFEEDLVGVLSGERIGFEY